MKKIVNIDKIIEFPSMIGEITAITLEHNLKYKDSNNIVGSLIVKGKYKRTEASRLEEEFNFEIPTEILLTETLDLNTAKVEIDDFYYEIEDEENINCHIKIMVEGVELVEIEEEQILENHIKKIDTIVDNTDDERECDGDPIYEEDYVEEKNEKYEPEKYINTEEMNEKVITNNSIFKEINNEETYSTYSVYIVREDETIEKILSKYKISKEELEKYNEITEIKNGTKLIIPIPKNVD